jgi:hypothetical protein
MEKREKQKERRSKRLIFSPSPFVPVYERIEYLLLTKIPNINVTTNNNKKNKNNLRDFFLKTEIALSP